MDLCANYFKNKVYVLNHKKVDISKVPNLSLKVLSRVTILTFPATILIIKI
jgi:hypothetical protein